MQPLAHPIPDQALRESGAIIGRRGSGKTYVAKGIVERKLSAGERTCIVDPTGAWWGLRSSADGTKPGFPVLVFGGDHADVSLSEGMGAALAEQIGTQNLPAIVDVSEFSMAGRVRFMTAFLEQLYRVNRMPLTLVIDEADMFAPQCPAKDELTMLGRMEQISRRGRVRGFRPWLITQRPASLHKAVLSQVNTLVAMQLVAPQDRAALGDWIEGQADRDEGKRILAELPKLPQGEGFVWAPHHEMLERVKFPAITTFDSSRSPEDGVAPEAVNLAKVDLTQLSATLLDLAEPNADVSASRGLRRGFSAARAAEEWPALRRLRDMLAEAVRAIDALGQGVAEGKSDGRERTKASTAPTAPIPRHPRRKRLPATHQRGREGGGPSILGSGERAVLVAIAQYPRGVTRQQITILTGYKRSTRDAYVQRLVARCLVGVEGVGTIIALKAGREALGSDFQPLPTGARLRAHWLAKLPEGERKAFEVVVSAYPKPVERDAVSERTGYKRSTRDAYLQRLAARKLITANRGQVRANEDLFR